MKLDIQGKTFLQHEEGCRLVAYQDRAKIWTIAYGNTYHLDGTPVKEGDEVSQEQADQLFDIIVEQYEKEVSTIPSLTQSQFNSCVSLCWNIGIHGFNTSSLHELISHNPNTENTVKTDDILEVYIKNQLIKEKHLYIPSIAYCFLKWSKDGGSFDIGLWRRRWREIDIYLNIK